VLPEDWGALKRILAVRLDNAGDVLMLGPALRAVPAASPGADLTLMESPAGARAAARSRRVVALPRETSLEEFAALVARARLLVGNNSTAMHLDALRCPMVILFSGTDLEAQWQPRSAPARLLRRPTPCDPCYRCQCPFHLECLDISPREVVQACEEMLARTAHRFGAVERPPSARLANPAAMSRSTAERSLSLGSEGAA
jgi:ADP-heptose:LPS heptosyltransferase